MALTSASTLTDALAQFNNNLAWDNDTVKAAAALEAVRWLLVNRGQDITQGPERLTFETLKDMEKKLEAFVSSAGATTTNSAPFVSMRPL